MPACSSYIGVEFPLAPELDGKAATPAAASARPVAPAARRRKFGLDIEGPSLVVGIV